MLWSCLEYAQSIKPKHLRQIACLEEKSWFQIRKLQACKRMKLTSLSSKNTPTWYWWGIARPKSTKLSQPAIVSCRGSTTPPFFAVPSALSKLLPSPSFGSNWFRSPKLPSLTTALAANWNLRFKILQFLIYCKNNTSNLLQKMMKNMKFPNLEKFAIKFWHKKKAFPTKLEALK